MCTSNQLRPEQIAHGRALVTERGCASCHEIKGIKKPDNFAPELTVVGGESLMKIVFAPGVAHTLPDYLQAKIKQPHAFPSAKMPQYSFTGAQVDALSHSVAGADRTRPDHAGSRCASRAGANPTIARPARRVN